MLGSMNFPTERKTLQDSEFLHSEKSTALGQRPQHKE
jgi:hypothetical protein